ncbi:hypothetical protein Tco_0438616, partial [Tanacetum coccineum]
LVSAGCTMVLLVVIFPAGRLVSAGGSSFHPAGSTPMSGSAVPDTAGDPLDTTGTASTVPTSAAMDSAASHHELGISPFADSDNSSSPSPVSTDHIPIDVLFEPTPGGINAFFLDSDEDEQIGLSRVAAEPDSDDEVLAEILFRGHYVSGAGVVVVDKLPDDEIVDPRVKVEPISESASSPPRSRSKHRGVRSDTSLWDRPVDDFLSSESESDDDIEDYIPPIPYGAFKDWEIVRCPLRNTYYHVYYQENRRHKNFFYLKELLATTCLSCGSSTFTSTDDRSQFHPNNVGMVLLAWECFRLFKLDYENHFRVSCKSDPLKRVESVINPPWNLPFLGANGLNSNGANGLQFDHGSLHLSGGQNMSTPVFLVIGNETFKFHFIFQWIHSITGVNTPGSDENRLKFYVLMYILVHVAVAPKTGSCC